MSNTLRKLIGKTASDWLCKSSFHPNIFYMQGRRLVVFCAESDISWQIKDDKAGRPALLRTLVLVSSAAVQNCTSPHTLLSAMVLPERLPLPP